MRSKTKTVLETGDGSSTVIAVSGLSVVDVFNRLMKYNNKCDALAILGTASKEGQYQDPNKSFVIIGSGMGTINEQYTIIAVKNAMPELIKKKESSGIDAVQQTVNDFSLNGTDKLFTPSELLFISGCLAGMYEDCVNTAVKKLSKALVLVNSKLGLLREEKTNEK